MIFGTLFVLFAVDPVHKLLICMPRVLLILIVLCKEWHARPVTGVQGHAIRWDMDALDEDVHGCDHYLNRHVMPSDTVVDGGFADSATTLAAPAALLWHFARSILL